MELEQRRRTEPWMEDFWIWNPVYRRRYMLARNTQQKPVKVDYGVYFGAVDGSRVFFIERDGNIMRYTSSVHSSVVWINGEPAMRLDSSVRVTNKAEIEYVHRLLERWPKRFNT
jgi:hypothetical protein